MICSASPKSDGHWSGELDHERIFFTLNTSGSPWPRPFGRATSVWADPMTHG